MFDAKHHAAHIDAEDALELFRRHLGNADHRRARPRIVDQTIEAAKPRDGMVDHRLYIGLDTDIRSNETERVAASCFECLAFLGASPAGHDTSTLRDEQFGDAFANSAGRASDNRDFSVKLAHGLSSSLRIGRGQAEFAIFK
ncbi:MAG TPA: hypothetical protein VKI44_36270 [Acetobacteraceae bacterium]|nr:hypothetical protein [Acetobacteraceae bacterium]